MITGRKTARSGSASGVEAAAGSMALAEPGAWAAGGQNDFHHVTTSRDVRGGAFLLVQITLVRPGAGK